MKHLHWGYKILLAYLLFVAGIVYLVVRSSQQRMDLVLTNYYEEELRYQEKIDQSRNAAQLSKLPDIWLSDGYLHTRFPPELQGKSCAGELWLYCPAEKNLDIHSSFDVQDAYWKVAVPASNRGPHVVRLSFMAGKDKYYVEKDITLP